MLLYQQHFSCQEPRRPPWMRVIHLDGCQLWYSSWTAGIIETIRWDIGVLLPTHRVIFGAYLPWVALPANDWPVGVTVVCRKSVGQRSHDVAELSRKQQCSVDFDFEKVPSADLGTRNHRWNVIRSETVSCIRSVLVVIEAVVVIIDASRSGADCRSADFWIVFKIM